jgi:hypothetical protein
MLLAKVVAGLRLGLTPGDNVLQLADKVLQVLAGKFPTEPKYQSWYAAHGGESLGNLAGSCKGDSRNLPRETPPPFLFAVKPTAAPPAPKPEGGKRPCFTNRSRLTAPARGEKAQMPASPTNSTEYRLKERKFLTVRRPVKRGKHANAEQS